jgi:hypothetical protein
MIETIIFTFITCFFINWRDGGGWSVPSCCCCCWVAVENLLDYRYFGGQIFSWHLNLLEHPLKKNPTCTVAILNIAMCKYYSIVLRICNTKTKISKTDVSQSRSSTHCLSVSRENTKCQHFWILLVSIPVLFKYVLIFSNRSFLLFHNTAGRLVTSQICTSPICTSPICKSASSYINTTRK